MASALSLIQIVFTFGLMHLYTWFERRSSVSLIPEPMHRPNRTARSSKDRLVIGFNIAFMALLLGAPLMALVFRSLLTENGPGLVYYISLLENRAQSILYIAPIAAIANSMGYALGAEGVEADPDHATFPAVDTETEFGVEHKVKMRIPMFSGALGSTDIARKNWEHFAVGTAITGISLVCGENVCGIDPKLELDKKGKVKKAPDMV